MAQQTYHLESHNLDGRGAKPTRVYALPPAPPIDASLPDYREYWPAVTDVPCPATGCAGTIRWAEAGYVPGYRICDTCRRHFLAKGTADSPTLLRVGQRRGGR